MRKIACFLLLVCGVATLPAAETWRWRDANGVVHFSDRPVPGAERIDLGSAPRPGSAATTATASRPASNPAPSNDGQIVPYARCVLLSPTNDQVLLNESTVQVAFDLQPGLQSGHQVQLFLNGAVWSDWSPTATQGSLTVTERGTFTLVARVVGETGRDLCTSPQSVFHVRLPTVPVVRPTPR